MGGCGGVERRPQFGLGAAVVADGDLAGLGEFFAQAFDAVVQRVWVGGADGDDEGGVQGPFVDVGFELAVVFGKLAPGGDEFGVAVAYVAALGELVVDVAFGAVVAHEFHFAA